MSRRFAVRPTLSCRSEGHAIILSLAAIGIAFVAVRAERDNYLALFAGVFPIVLGWICGVIALEIALARGGGMRAVRSGIQIGT